MALQEIGFASAQMGDSAHHLGSASFIVSVVDAKAWVNAADDTARQATEVGKLLRRALNITRSGGTNGERLYECGLRIINDAFVYPDKDAAIYNSNKWKVTGRTTNGIMPAQDTVYIPEYLITTVVMESDGISALLTDDPVALFVTEFLATALSKFFTPFTSIVSIQRNDS